MLVLPVFNSCLMVLILMWKIIRLLILLHGIQQLGSNGAHVLSARARDAKGNTATSTNVNVNVVPDFLFTVLTPAKNVEMTGNTDFRIYVSYLNGYTTTGINLSVTGLPANATGHFLFNPMSHQGETQLIINTN